MSTFACGCASPDCRANGCALARRQREQSLPVTHPWPPQPYWPRWPFMPPQAHGCVCPVGAEKTCAGPLCPRKPIGPVPIGPVT